MATQNQATEALEALLLSDDFCNRFAARIEDRLCDSLCETVGAALEARLEDAVKTINDLSQENAALKKQVKQLQQKFDCRLDGLVQYQRRNNVRLSGVLEADGDDRASTSVAAMVDLLNAKLGLEIRPNHIDRCHCVGCRVRAGAPPRQVLIKFVSY
ncbi:uncharacterized protein LOC120350688 [Nilaparvata lugens]|uniref:uncharacterized protein LOC120350688 n=1 Tax=Nilaparvata lugens TaxID=108931 RepID=UPI00193DEEB6|nr:uncharacterized protein LOC120350688 [Nilaparvata lugens]